MRTPEISDTQLVELTLDNQQNFSTLMERYEDRLLRFILRISNVSREEAEDILQETFLKAYLNLRGFDQQQSFSAWIYRIARNQTISTFRKRSARPQGHTIDMDDAVLEFIRADIDLDKTIDTHLLREYFEHLLISIEPKYREVLVLRFFEDRSYAEIAQIVRRPEGTVATWINRAKNALAAEFEKEQNQKL